MPQSIRFLARAPTSWYHGLRMRVFAVQERIRFARDARHLNPLEIELTRQGIQRPHHVADRLMTMNVAMRGVRFLRLGPERWGGTLDDELRVIRARQDVEVQRIVQHEIE